MRVFLTVVVVVAALVGRAEAQSNLSPEDWQALQEGEIDPVSHVVGGAVGTVFGFGLGHAVQGRMEDKGWMFLGGEIGGAAALLIGLGICYGDAVDDIGEGAVSNDHCPVWLVAGGAIAFGVFRIWELVDVWGGPAWHNDRVRRARARAFMPYVAPSFRVDGSLGGMQAGLSLRF